ncbi:Sec-independent protein translocase subunit TatB [Streptomyces sp. NPDC055722]
MFFDIGPLELVTLFVLAVILGGPEKLPSMVSSAARTLHKFREFSQSAQAGIRNELPPELQDMALEDLDPKVLVRKHLLSAEDLVLSEPETSPDLEGEAPDSPTTDVPKKPQGAMDSAAVVSRH